MTNTNIPLINIIGAGKVGKTLAKLLIMHGLARIGFICNRSLETASAAAAFIGEGKGVSAIAELAEADLTLISAPDDCILPISIELAQHQRIKPKSLIVHLSGSLSTEVLKPMQAHDCLLASLHPMRSFANLELSISEFKGTYCALEGDKAATAVLSRLLKAMGAIPYELDKNKKIIYHAAGVFASNYLLVLAEQALSCLKEAGIEDALAVKLTTSLMRGTLANLEKTNSPSASLTGPIQRADLTTIAKHTKALSLSQKKLYESLGLAAIELTAHDATKKAELAEVLLLK